ncbi:hypothetical protein [Streptococcus dentiloxodontae]
MKKTPFIEKHTASFLAAVVTVLCYLIVFLIFRKGISEMAHLWLDELVQSDWGTRFLLCFLLVLIVFLICIPGLIVYAIADLCLTGYLKSKHFYSSTFFRKASYRMADDEKVSAIVLKKLKKRTDYSEYSHYYPYLSYEFVVKVDGKKQRVSCTLDDYQNYQVGDEITLTRFTVVRDGKIDGYAYKRW